MGKLGTLTPEHVILVMNSALFLHVIARFAAYCAKLCDKLRETPAARPD